MSKAPTYQSLIDQSREDQRELEAMSRRLDQAVLRARIAETVPRALVTLPRNPNDVYQRQFGMARPAPESHAGALDARAVSRQRRRLLARGSRPNAGLEAMYRQKLDTMIGQMNASVLYWLRSAYRNNPPEMSNDALGSDRPAHDDVRDGVAGARDSRGMDSAPFNQPEMTHGTIGIGISGSSPADMGGREPRHDIGSDRDVGTPLALDRSSASILKIAFDKLAKRWLRNFDDLADRLGIWFGEAASDRSDAALKRALSQSGFAVKFTMTPAMRDVLHATVNENVSLIRSIPQQYLTQVEGSVMRSVTAGRDLASLTTELRGHYGVSKRRAKFIALDQNNKATAAFTRVRQVQYDLQAIWMHSHAGKTPRPTHVANNGKPYDPAVGWYDPAVKKRIWPGTEPRCRCYSRTVIPGFQH